MVIFVKNSYLNMELKNPNNHFFDKLKRIKMVCDDNQIREGLENITKKQTIYKLAYKSLFINFISIFIIKISEQKLLEK